MTAYVAYAYYTGTYLGTLIPSADFAKMALRASAVIDQLCYNRAAAVITANTDTDTIDKIQMATCAVADELYSQNTGSGGAIQSERVGNVSVTYAAPRSQSANASKAAALYLWDTDLMYRGFADGEYSGDTEDDAD